MTMALYQCHYCHRDTDKPTRDHIVPRSKGGRDGSWNIVPACGPCNRAKGSDDPTCECRKCQESIRRHQELAARGLAFPPPLQPKPLSALPPAAAVDTSWIRPELRRWYRKHIPMGQSPTTK